MVIVFWTIWVTLMTSFFIYQIFLGKGFPEGKDAAEPLNIAYHILCFGTVIGATFVRWIVLPKVKMIQQALVCFIVGMSLSEAVVFYEIFLIGPDYPESQMAYFILSFMSAFQFIPIYLGRFNSQNPLKIE